MRVIRGINDIIRRCCGEMVCLCCHHSAICEGCGSVAGWLNVLTVRDFRELRTWLNDPFTTPEQEFKKNDDIVWVSVSCFVRYRRANNI